MALTRRRFVGLLGAGAVAAYASDAKLLLDILGVPSAFAQDLPETSANQGKGKKVAIIGAGIAGLTLAYELTRAGYGVSVFEGTKRYGGRSLTVRPANSDYRSWYLSQCKFAGPDSYCDFIPAEVRGPKVPEQTAQFVPYRLGDGYVETYFNTGPGRIPTIHTGVLHYCREFGVELEPFIYSSGTNLLQSEKLNNGKPVLVREFVSDIRGYISELLYDSVSSSKSVAPGLDAQAAASQLKKFLVEFGDLSPDGSFQGTTRAGYAIVPGAGDNSGIVREKLPLAQLLEAQALWPGLIRRTETKWQQPLLQPVGGMDMIWQAFLSQRVGGSELRDRVRLASPVQGLRYQDAEGSKIVVSLQASDRPEEAFDYVVMTGSPPNLLTLDTDDLVDDQTIDDIRSLLFQRGGKYGWQARDRFWEQPGANIFGGISWTSREIEQIWYPSDGWNQPTGVLTGAYVKAPLPSDLNGMMYSSAQDYRVPIDPDDLPAGLTHTVRWARMDQDQRTKAALAGGEALHPGFTDHVYSDAGLSVGWDNQPYQFGINSDDNFAMRPESYSRLIEPLDRYGRLYLAGDGLSFWNGWQEGAVRSAWWTLQKIYNHTASQAQSRAADG